MRNQKSVRGQPVTQRQVQKKAFLITAGIAVFIIIAVFAVRLLFHPVIVVGPSMEPTYHAGEVLTSDTNFEPEDITYGSIVVVKGNDGRPLIKRVVGLPGDTIEVKTSGVYRNGVHQPDDFGTTHVTGREVTLAKDEYYILGDNRDNSTDSRSFGPVKFESITNMIRTK